MPEASDASTQRADSATQTRQSIAESAGIYLRARRALLASLGAIAITMDETNEFLSRLIERGEMAESDIAQFVSEYIMRKAPGDQEEPEPPVNKESKVETSLRAPAERTSIALAESVEVILERLNVPTHADIEELSRKISVLNEKVTALKERGGQLRANGQAAAVASDGEPMHEGRRSVEG